jgi:hypothetical protein
MLQRLLPVLLSLTLLGCAGRTPASSGPAAPALAPESTAVDLEVRPRLQVIRSRVRDGAGTAVILIMVESPGRAIPSDVRAAVWLPDGVVPFAGVPATGSPTDPWLWDVRVAGEPARLLISTRFDFPDYMSYPNLIAAFGEPTCLTLLWGGSERQLCFPGSLWRVELIDDSTS